MLGQADKQAPSNRVNLGCIGMGWAGTVNLKSFLAQSDCQVRAVSDVDQEHAEAGKETVNQHYGNKDCRAYYDFRELLARPDLDAVSVALPDHWHAISVVLAARAGLDIFGEQPLAHSVREGRAICRAVARYARIWQTGSWQPAERESWFAAELVRNGRIGKVHTVEVGLPEGHTDYAGTAGQETPSRPPPGLDYEFWLGPSPWAPYCPARVHKNWRWHLDYGGGQLMDWLGHYTGMAHWSLGLDQTGPVEVEATGEYPRRGLWNAPTKYRIVARYQPDVTLIIAGGHGDIHGGTCWRGNSGWIRVDRGGLDAHPKALLEERIGENEIRIPSSPGRHREFINSVKSRRPTFAAAEVAQRSVIPGHLGLISMRIGRKIMWDPAMEETVGDELASRLLVTTLREPWTL